MPDSPWIVRVRVLSGGRVQTTFRAPTLSGLWHWIGSRQHLQKFQRATGRRFIDRASHPAVVDK